VATGALAAPAAQEGHQHAAPEARYTPPENPGLIRSALDCVHTGDVCIDHCYQTFQAGDTSLAECVRRVQELVAACAALARLASLDSPHLAEFAAATAKVCRSCEKECRKHEAHKPCKDCGDACAACARECDQLRA
jgi:Cys-rich four helix bundle protein (predicted Tat secretion target)